MRHAFFAFLLCLLLSSPTGAVSAAGATEESPQATGTQGSQDLMDLDDPEGDGAGGPLLRLPEAEDRGPTQEEVSPTLLTLPLETKQADEAVVPQPPSPGISPAVLPQPDVIPEREAPPMEPGEIIPAQAGEPDRLKAFEPAAKEMKTLRVTATQEEAADQEVEAAGMPRLIEEKAVPMEAPSEETEKVPALKPVAEEGAPALREDSVDAAERQPTVASVDMPAWLGLDRKLVEIYERFYGKDILRAGDRGLKVEKIQRALKEKGYYDGPFDGRFTLELTRAVKAFQKEENLTVDGIVGPITIRELGLS